MSNFKTIEIFYGIIIVSFFVLSVMSYYRNSSDYLLFVVLTLVVVIAYDIKTELKLIRQNTSISFLADDAQKEELSVDEFMAILNEIKEEEEGKDEDKDQDNKDKDDENTP